MSNSAAAEAALAPLSAPAYIAKQVKALPPVAQAKYERLRRASQRARAIVDGLQMEIDRARDRRASAMTNLVLHDRHYPEQYTYEEGPNGTRKRVVAHDPQRAELAATLDAATAELARLQEEARAVVVPRLADIEEWIGESGSAKHVPAIFPAAKVGKQEPLAAALDRIMEDQRRIADELAATRNAPRTVAEARTAMRDELARLAARGRPDAAGLFTGEPIKWPTLQVIASSFGAHQYTNAAEVTDTVALLAWLHQDAITARLVAELEAHGGDDADALSAADQAARIQELEAKLLVLQRQAEAVIELLEGDGIAVQRTCWDPLIVLGIERARA